MQAWDDYIQTVDLAMAERASGRRSFLWVDESPDLVRRVRGGELLVSSQDHPKLPQGLIHHWIGAMFLPNTTLDNVTDLLDDYDRYETFYRPLVGKSKVLYRTGDCRKVTLLMVQKAFGVTAAVETEDEIRIEKLHTSMAYSLSNSVRVQEIADYGQSNEHPFPEDRGPGYVWRTHGVTRIEQRDGGVYVEIETIALSRGIPWEFRWLVEPLTEHLPRTIMFETLKNTRDAVAEETERTQIKITKSGKSGS